MKQFPIVPLLASVAVCIGSSLAVVASAQAGERGNRPAQVVDDTVISGAVQRALNADPTFTGHRIYVETYRGAVQLSGWVLSAEQKAKASELASTITGVRSVTNELELDTTRTAAR